MMIPMWWNFKGNMYLFQFSDNGIYKSITITSDHLTLSAMKDIQAELTCRYQQEQKIRSLPSSPSTSQQQSKYNPSTTLFNISKVEQLAGKNAKVSSILNSLDIQPNVHYTPIVPLIP